MRDAIPEAPRSRRAFVFFGALAAAAALPRSTRAQAPSRRRIKPRPTVNRLDPTAPSNPAAFAEWDSDLARLVRRATLGITPPEVASATRGGWQSYLNDQINAARIDDSVVENFVAQQWPFVAMTSDDLFSANATQVKEQLQEATIYRAAFSRRQLYHRMVEFWTDHFNQDITKVGYLLVTDQRDVIRAHALGTFPALLKASAHSPSMLAYLDQNTSRASAPNQNYAREIMELHTLGVNGGYTQTDVAELSRVLTGWTIQGRGEFIFNPAIHDTGDKTVLGVSIPGQSGAAGINEGEQVLDLLANHPSTAQFIATKMLQWLLDPNPSDTQISAIASVYRATGGDIKSMVRAIMNDSWVPASPMKFKRPFHFLVSAIRATNPTITIMSGLNSQLAALGHPIYTWQTPDGFPDQIDYWAGNIEPRWSFANVMANMKSSTTVSFDTTAYEAGSPDAAIDLIDANFFGSEMPLATRTALLAYVKAGTFTDARVRETIGLAMAANAFQWY